MSDKESDDEMPDAELGSSKSEQNGDTVDFGELKVSGQDSIAAGVAAGNIHLQSANAATLALPEVRSSRNSVFGMLVGQDAVQSVLHRPPPSHSQADQWVDSVLGQQGSKGTARTTASSC